MNKLVELLNEYEYDKRKEKTLRGMTNGCLYYIQSITSYLDLKIISKEYGFIKWLVDNDKIDHKELPYLGEYGMGVDIPTDGIIMLLSISDTPIDDLIGYLK